MQPALRTPRSALLLTPGDPAGIGPEVALKAWVKLRRRYTLAFTGPEWVWRQTARRLGLPSPGSCMAVPALKTVDEYSVRFGAMDPRGGTIAIECVREAAHACMRGDAAAMVTAPLTKAGIHAAGYHYEGHTDFLAEVTGARRHAMMLSSGPLRVLLVTIHQSLSSVPKGLTKVKILDKIVLADETGRRMGMKRPRIAVCGLNPHAGEAGAFGTEETRVIAPAIAAARRKGVLVSGPYPGDTVFCRAKDGEFDFVIAMYHDQGLIPVKLFGFDEGVNTTLGLPIVRTSPDHGTAYDKAGKGVASPSSMIAAIRMAASLAD
ncbi:4-hydroxythreonine-4-phosphate dehydrogenase PdxA [bacterium]|nr:4-hydroxythreonine-4-phosphate dehydrogenase PdxA [bacterium]